MSCCEVCGEDCEYEQERVPKLKPEQWSRIHFLVMREADRYRGEGRLDLAQEFDTILKDVRGY